MTIKILTIYQKNVAKIKEPMINTQHNILKILHIKFLHVFTY